MDRIEARPTEDIRPAGRRWARALRLLAILVLVPYLGVVSVFASLQTKLIFPGAETQGRPEYAVKPPPGTELVRLKTAGGDRVVALFGPALKPDGSPDPEASKRPTILDFYGNGMCLKYAANDLDGFRKLGANVLIAEYVGYGMSGGSPSEAGCYATADAAYDYLLTRKDVDPTRIVALGWSLGGAVAIDLASRRPVAALVAFSTFTSMADAARYHYKMLPAGLLLRHRFESLKKIPGIKVPTLIAHGKADSLVPPAMSETLARAAGGRVATYWVEGAGHNDFFETGGDRLLDALGKFLDALPGPGR